MDKCNVMQVDYHKKKQEKLTKKQNHPEIILLQTIKKIFFLATMESVEFYTVLSLDLGLDCNFLENLHFWGEI